MVKSSIAVRTFIFAALTVLLSLSPYVVFAEDGKVDINTATSQALTALEGVGEVIAERIVAFRQEHGLFKDITDIKKIKGIAEEKFEKIKNKIIIGATTTESAH